ncbi:MAG: DUF6677 family protein [Planctomycetota bacterium]
MPQQSKENCLLFPLTVGLFAWLIPGAGHFALKEKTRAIIICATIIPTFCAGLYIGSIGVVDTVGPTPWYVYSAQIMTSPAVAMLAWVTAGGNYPAHGWPNEIGQIYTSTAGLLNLLCIVNAVYLAYLRTVQTTGG